MFGSAYWSTYKRIEQEVLELSHSICFDDNQLKVYSNGILDLIVRICTNIESLYEDIYRDEFSKTELKKHLCHYVYYSKASISFYSSLSRLLMRRGRGRSSGICWVGGRRDIH